MAALWSPSARELGVAVGQNDAEKVVARNIFRNASAIPLDRVPGGSVAGIPVLVIFGEFWRVLVLPQLPEKRNFSRNASQYWNVQSLLMPKQTLYRHKDNPDGRPRTSKPRQ
jgi:hypothetical protein